MRNTAKKSKNADTIKTAKAPKKLKPSSKKAPKRSFLQKGNKSMSTYSSLVYRSKMKKEKRARKRAEDLATLPKNPVKRFFAHLHPKRVFKYWFSLRGLKTFLKIIAATVLIIIIALGGLFLYYKKDLEAIQLDKLKVSETVNTYLDRNGEILWEDKGDGDYRLVVDGDQISTYMRQATVAIEDRNFYNHNGIDLWSLIRAAFSTLSGKSVQGGSTLTQQLIKQVYFSDEAKDRGLSGIPRKIKEAILAVEVEKMYDKEQIITMYLNESPYGGRRNGVDSGAQTYFGKSAKDLTLAEAALLAAIPNNPAVLNPYNEYGHEALLWRQQYTLDVMAELGYITKEEAEEAKAVPILDTIKPETNQYDNIKAPHFVLEVKDMLEEKYGVKTMRAGGFTIKTTLDYRAQQMAEQAVANGAALMYSNGSDNIALASVDVETAQVIAMVGSVDWKIPGYGEVNAATAELEPGSSMKPIIDYGPLFMQRQGQNYGPGSVLKDENIDSIYCAGYRGTCALRNYTGSWYGNVTIRRALAGSLNIPAVKALYINGVENSLKVAQGLGDKHYCADDSWSGGLSIAIGSGCNVTAIEHANAFASIARGGVYKELSYILELKNSSGDIIESWTDNGGERVYDDQVAYMLSSILSDANARTITFGSQGYSFGFVIPNVKTATKTGTTTTTNASVAKDSWILSYSPVIATAVWNGNHDGGALRDSSNTIVRRVVNDYMGPVHTQLYANEGKWTVNQDFVKPAGIQTLTVNGQTDIWPSWYNSKTSGVTTETLTFNKYTHKLATACTPENQKIQIEVTKTIDPITRREVYSVPQPYTRDEQDDCSYTAPGVNLYQSGDKLKAVITVGSSPEVKYVLYEDGAAYESGVASGTSIDFGYDLSSSGITGRTLKVVVTDSNGAESSSQCTIITKDGENKCT
ncbi:penicillin-binding protein [Candidatus Saccharibacteria bacterium]|nr:penicillin-binding protein [Candidatus Saccharibacteria bacterium]